MFVYLDETEFDEGKFCGYASLITEERISQTVIDTALEELRNDPARFLEPQKPMDDRTLDHGYFHAVDDSKNAHSYICTAINKQVIGNFNAHIFHTSKHNFSNVEDIYEIASKLAVVGLFSKSAKITFIFEQRNGLSVKTLFEKWWPDLWAALRQNCYASPFIIKYYPDVKFEIAGKNEPGIQVVDFMLWALQRKIAGKDSRWFDRLNGWSKTSSETVGGGWETHSISKILPKNPNLKRYGIEDSPPMNQNLDPPMVLINVQKAINIAHSLANNDCVKHLKSDIEFIVNNRRNQKDIDFIFRMADCFIKLFDNLPIISNETTSSDKQFWLAARKSMAFIFLDGLDARFHTLMLCDVRNDLVSNHPDQFDEGAAAKTECNT